MFELSDFGKKRWQDRCGSRRCGVDGGARCIWHEAPWGPAQELRARSSGRQGGSFRAKGFPRLPHPSGQLFCTNRGAGGSPLSPDTVSATRNFGSHKASDRREDSPRDCFLIRLTSRRGPGGGGRFIQCPAGDCEAIRRVGASDSLTETRRFRAALAIGLEPIAPQRLDGMASSGACGRGALAHAL